MHLWWALQPFGLMISLDQHVCYAIESMTASKLHGSHVLEWPLSALALDVLSVQM